MNFKERDYATQVLVHSDMKAARVKQDVKNFERFNFLKNEVLNNLVQDYATGKPIGLRYTSGEKTVGSVRMQNGVLQDICVTNKMREAGAIKIFMHEVAHIVGGHFNNDKRAEFSNIDKELIAELTSVQMIEELGLTFENIADRTYFNRITSQGTSLYGYGAYTNVYDNELCVMTNNAATTRINNEVEQIVELITKSINLDYWQENYADQALDYSYLKQLLNHQTKKYRKLTKHQARLHYFYEFDNIYITFSQDKKRTVLEIDATSENLVVSHVTTAEYGEKTKTVLNEDAEFQQLYILIKEYRNKYGILDWRTAE